MATENKRELSLDIARSFAVIFTISVHFITNSGFLGIRMEGAGSFIMLLAWLLAKTCVPLFLMLTGYLCHKKQLSAQFYLGIVRVLVIYFFASVVCLLFEHFVNGQEMGLRYVFGSIVNFHACYYGWYVSLYLGLFIMMPFLNAMYHAMDSRRKKQILILSFLAVSILPSLLNTYVQLYSMWWQKLWPIPLYFVGAYLSEYKPRASAPKAGVLLLLALLVFAVFDCFHFKGDGAQANLIDYDHYQNFIISVLCFVFFLSLPAEKLPAAVGKMFSRISALSFAIYLCSSVSDGYIYPIFVRYVPEYTDRYIWMPLMVAISFLMSALLAWILSFVYEPCIKLVKNLLHRAIVK